jgi:hypothetical protein
LCDNPVKLAALGDYTSICVGGITFGIEMGICAEQAVAA